MTESFSHKVRKAVTKGAQYPHIDGRRYSRKELEAEAISVQLNFVEQLEGIKSNLRLKPNLSTEEIARLVAHRARLIEVHKKPQARRRR